MVDEVDHRAQDGQGIGPGVVLEDTWEVIAPIGKGKCLILGNRLSLMSDSRECRPAHKSLLHISWY